MSPLCLPVLLVCATVVCSTHVRSQERDAGVITSDSAVYVTLLGRREASIAPKALDLRGFLGAEFVSRQLARRLAGFDTLLVAQLHLADPRGRGPRVALRMRPELLTRSPDSTVFGPRARLNLHDGAIVREQIPFVAYRVELEYSVVQYSPAGDVAIVWEATRCGPLCGGSRYVVLRRTSVDQWVIVVSYQDAVS